MKKGTRQDGPCRGFRSERLERLERMQLTASSSAFPPPASHGASRLGTHGRRWSRSTSAPFIGCFQFVPMPPFSFFCFCGWSFLFFLSGPHHPAWPSPNRFERWRFAAEFRTMCWGGQSFVVWAARRERPHHPATLQKPPPRAPFLLWPLRGPRSVLRPCGPGPPHAAVDCTANTTI